MIPALSRVLAVLVLAASLAACGFQLRGAGDWPAQLDPVEIRGLQPRDSLYQELARGLRASGVEVVDSRPEERGVTLEIRSVDDSRRALSVSDQARVSEYELVRRVQVRLHPADGEAVDLEPLRASRTYVYDETAVLSRSEREEDLRDTMNRDLVALLRRQVEALERPADGD
ncbi:LPS assembly lipoprotein LptE [Thioalkalivibrio sp. ALJ24]|uniref:LPS-assembly lipoprotein LptE n=1 Tax=Thioalkalivibrio sp. ALJ24 TaxID=545276 RepID=UPI0003791696|nr:LPS assembly lipoprotein LptE [Thioalkalivibrio sp. ALJ24]